jgi:hypothetical protein
MVTGCQGASPTLALGVRKRRPPRGDVGGEAGGVRLGQLVGLVAGLLMLGRGQIGSPDHRIDPLQLQRVDDLPQLGRRRLVVRARLVADERPVVVERQQRVVVTRFGPAPVLVSADA